MNQHPEPPAEELVVTVKEAAARLKVSEWMIHRLIRERELPSVTAGTRRLIPYRDLTHYIERRRTAERGVPHAA